MKKSILLLFFLYSLQSFSQDIYREESEENTTDQFPMFIGIYPSISIPVGAFSDNMNRIGLGGGFEFLVNIKQTQFYAGFASNIANYGNETLEFIDTDGFTLDWKTNSSLWDNHLLVQYEPLMKQEFQLYVQGKIGINHFFTVTKLVDEETGGENEVLERFVDGKSTTFSYGGSIGALIPLDKEWHFMLDLRASYLRGTNASYYSKLNNFTIVGDTLDAFDLQESTTNMLRFEVGVLFYIWAG